MGAGVSVRRPMKPLSALYRKPPLWTKRIEGLERVACSRSLPLEISAAHAGCIDQGSANIGQSIRAPRSSTIRLGASKAANDRPAESNVILTEPSTARERCADVRVRNRRGIMPSERRTSLLDGSTDLPICECQHILSISRGTEEMPTMKFSLRESVPILNRDAPITTRIAALVFLISFCMSLHLLVNLISATHLLSLQNSSSPKMSGDSLRRP